MAESMRQSYILWSHFKDLHRANASKNARVLWSYEAHSKWYSPFTLALLFTKMVFCRVLKIFRLPYSSRKTGSPLPKRMHPSVAGCRWMGAPSSHSSTGAQHRPGHSCHLLCLQQVGRVHSQPANRRVHPTVCWRLSLFNSPYFLWHGQVHLQHSSFQSQGL